MDPFLVPCGQHYTSTLYSTFLPATGSPLLCCFTLCHASTLTSTPRLLYCSVHLHPRITHSSILISATITASSTHIQIHASLKTPTAALNHSHCYSPVSHLQQCMITPTLDCTHLKRTPPAASGAPAAHRLFGSTARETTHILWLEADMQRSPRGGTKVWYTSALPAPRLSVCFWLGTWHLLRILYLTCL